MLLMGKFMHVLFARLRQSLAITEHNSYILCTNLYFRVPQVPGVELITPEDVQCFINESRNADVNFDRKCTGVDFQRIERGDVSFKDPPGKDCAYRNQGDIAPLKRDHMHFSIPVANYSHRFTLQLCGFLLVLTQQ